jgi:alpha-D-glucose phosphate-specific phosphoglucomutase
MNTMGKIEFGTDGWRSLMEEDFNLKNLEIVGKAISNYLITHNLILKPIIIGYDTRRNSRLFAETIARILMKNNISVILTTSDVPTPVVAFLILYSKTGGGVMITASHNPPGYNGIKFIPHYASPAMPEITDELMDYIEKIQNSKKRIEKYSGNLSQSGLYKELDPINLYINDILKKLDINNIRRHKFRVAVDPIYGTSRNYLAPILKKLDCEVYQIHSDIDPDFGGKMPNPSPEILKDLGELVIMESADIGMACDGDGDRSGIFDDRGRFIIANYLFGLLFKYHLDVGLKGDCVRTVSTSHLIDRIAEDYNLKVYETPVGSKYVGLYMREKNLLIGGESSGGLMFRDHIPEKDGIFTNIKTLEMMAFYEKKISDLLRDLLKRYGNFYYEQINVDCKDELKDKILDKLGEILPEKFAGFDVIKKIKMDGFKFVLEDNSWLLIRKSGTEPLLRLYCETQNKHSLKKLIEEGKKFLLTAQEEI